MQQQILPFQLNVAAQFNNFVVGENSQIINYLKNFAAQPSDFCSILYSEESGGKTHLLHALGHETKHSFIYLPLKEIVAYAKPDIFDNIEKMHIIALDDLEVIAGNKIFEEALFHLYNRIEAQKNHLIISTSFLPKAIPFLLPDLHSRCLNAVLLKLTPLNDEQKIIVMKQIASAKAMNLPDEVCKFILNHSVRNMHELKKLIDQLDKYSLIEKRKITVPFCKSILSLS